MPARINAASRLNAARRLVAGLLACLLLAPAGGLPPALALKAAPGDRPTVLSPGGSVISGQPAATRYRWPLDGQIEVARPFDPPALRWHPGHRGVDLAAAAQVVVRAAGDGVVRFAGTVVDRGVVSIDHVGGLRTTYEPVSATVMAGDRVLAGDPIGVLAVRHPGCPVEACLHWGLRHGQFYLDPLTLLGLGRVRLLPHPPAAGG